MCSQGATMSSTTRSNGSSAPASECSKDGPGSPSPAPPVPPGEVASGVVAAEEVASGEVAAADPSPGGPAADPSWLTSDVLAVARGIDAGGAFDRLPVLADALQDAGCADADVLAHCRGGGPHARGCVVVDLLLGRE